MDIKRLKDLLCLFWDSIQIVLNNSQLLTKQIGCPVDFRRHLLPPPQFEMTNDRRWVSLQGWAERTCPSTQRKKVIIDFREKLPLPSSILKVTVWRRFPLSNYGALYHCGPLLVRRHSYSAEEGPTVTPPSVEFLGRNKLEVKQLLMLYSSTTESLCG